MRTITIKVTAKDLFTALIEAEDKLVILKSDLPNSLNYSTTDIDFEFKTEGVDEPKPERRPKTK